MISDTSVYNLKKKKKSICKLNVVKLIVSILIFIDMTVFQFIMSKL